MPLPSSVVGQMMARFVTFAAYKNVNTDLVEKGAERRNMFRPGVKDLFKQKIFWG